jgi:hypothetical protein
LLGVRDGAVFKVSLDAMESVKREVKDVKIFAASGSGRSRRGSGIISSSA